MIVCVENCPYWNIYPHYSKYGDYNNTKIDIYYYNHIDKLKETEFFIAIPVIYAEINYYIKYHKDIYLKNDIPFEEKKFCLLSNRSKLNPDINKLVNSLSSIGQIDHISQYDPGINNVSCYHSEELLKIYNKYKFVIAIENSYSPGYITEKIFNCFFAKTIPIYAGPKNTNLFFNLNSFINISDFDNIDSDRIRLLSTNKEMYEKTINEKKISSEYNNENYESRLIDFIIKKINMKKKF
jgi:hypothetical protein